MNAAARYPKQGEIAWNVDTLRLWSLRIAALIAATLSSLVRHVSRVGHLACIARILGSPMPSIDHRPPPPPALSLTLTLFYRGLRSSQHITENPL